MQGARGRTCPRKASNKTQQMGNDNASSASTGSTSNDGDNNISPVVLHSERVAQPLHRRPSSLARRRRRRRALLGLLAPAPLHPLHHLHVHRQACPGAFSAELLGCRRGDSTARPEQLDDLAALQHTQQKQQSCIWCKGKHRRKNCSCQRQGIAHPLQPRRRTRSTRDAATRCRGRHDDAEKKKQETPTFLQRSTRPSLCEIAS